MALAAALDQVLASLQAMREALLDVRIAAIEDKPRRGDVVLVDVFGDAADELLGWLEDAVSEIGIARQAIEHGPDLYHVRRELIGCQQYYQRIALRFSFDLLSYARMAELMSCGRTRGDAWRGWANGLKNALERCRQPLYDLDQALFECWQELTERMGAASVSVQATNIGQQVMVPATEVATYTAAARQPLTQVEGV